MEDHPTREESDGPARVPVTVSQWREWNARLAKARAKAKEDRQDLAQQCQRELRDFGQQPGSHLWLVRAGIVRRELRTADQQTLARLRDLVPTAVSAGGRTFTRKQVTGSSWPGIAAYISSGLRTKNSWVSNRIRVGSSRVLPVLMHSSTSCAAASSRVR